MRNFEPLWNHVGNGSNCTLDEPETFVLTVFKTLLKQHLHAKANTHNGLATGGFFFYKVCHSALAQFARGILKRTYARQNQAVGGTNHGRVSRNNGFDADCGKRGSE